VFNDAATYDYATKTGGMDGSVVLSKEEAGRPENKGLEDLVKRLAKAKDAIDKGNAAIGSGLISWADTLVLAAKVAVEDEWREIKLARAANPAGGDKIVKAFGAQWDVRLGRLDSSEAAPSRALAPNADAETMRQFMLKLGAKVEDQGPFAPKPPFWERPAFVVYSAAQDNPLVCCLAPCAHVACYTRLYSIDPAAI
jgi:L-ascorbate peroxidase